MAFMKRSVAIQTNPLSDAPRPGRPSVDSKKGDVGHLLRKSTTDCDACGHKMTASDGSTCPECGAHQR